jgi:hypothetical protein
MATIDVKDAAGLTVAVEKPLPPGRVAAASSRPVALSTEDLAVVGGLTETAPTTDTASSGLNGRMQRLAQRFSTLIGLVPTSLATGGGLRVTVQDTAGAALDYTLPALVGGDIAHGSAIGAQKPVVIGGRGATANPTANADGNVTRMMTDKLGKVIAVSALRDLKARQVTSLTSTTTETTIVTAAGAGVFADLYGLIIENTSATGCEVTIRDVTATGVATSIYVPPTDTRGFMLDAGSAIPQGTANSAWTAQCGASVASIKITALYVKNL